MPQSGSTFTVPSRLTLSHAPQALAAGLEAIHQGATQFDFAAVTECDSAGVALCVRWSAATNQRGTVWSALNVPAALLRLAQVYDLSAALFGSSETGTAAKNQSAAAFQGLAS